jgi:hypothetical protein
MPGRHAPVQEIEMAKGQQRSNREAKKPKKVKPKTPATASSSATARPGAYAPGKKKS